MVLKVPANAREISHDTNVQRLENIGRPNTGEHEQLWRIDSPTRENNFVLGLNLLLSVLCSVGHPDSTCPIEEDARRESLRPDSQIGAILYRMQIPVGCATPFSLAYCGLQQTEAFLGCSVVIVIA